MAGETKTASDIDSIHGGTNAFQTVVDELEARKRDLVLAAEIGNHLLRQNEQLRKQNDDVAEHFRQKIFELEEERCLLKRRLMSVESDYDSQVKELQGDVSVLRADVQKQKCLYRELEAESAMNISELSHRNEVLNQHLAIANVDKSRLEKDLEDVRCQMEDHRNAMQGRLQQLDNLRQEITELREQKYRLETELSMVTQERDQLLDTVSESNGQLLKMQNIHEEQVATIIHQEDMIRELQNRATAMCIRLQDLSDQPKEGHVNRVTSLQPHHSLKAELIEERLKRKQNEYSDGIESSGSVGSEDDNVELDDEALSAFVSSYYGHVPGMNSKIVDRPANRLDQAGTGETSLFRGLGLEISEVYQQMQNMCVELSALHNTRLMRSCQPGDSQTINVGGTLTPDELAMVEMEARLASLRSVLGDLRGLLRDLTSFAVDEVQGGQNEQEFWDSTGKSKTVSDPKTIDSSNFAAVSMDVTDQEVMLSQRDALLEDVASTHNQLVSVKRDIELVSILNDSGTLNEDIHHLGIWKELAEEDKYEVELPH